MTDALADTSVFIARDAGRPVDLGRLPERLGISVVTIGELHAGVLGAADVQTRARRLATLLAALRLESAVIDASVAQAWASLRQALHEAGLRMPANDSWIAATAITLGVPVVTQDDDYDGVPGLDVIHV